MTPEPDDAAVLAAPASAPEDARDGLAAAVAAVEGAAGPLVEWRGGDRRPDGVVTMAWPAYAAPVGHLLAALGRAGAVPVFDWVHWDGGRRLRTADDVAAASLADVARLVTTIVRGERFADGDGRPRARGRPAAGGGAAAPRRPVTARAVWEDRSCRASSSTGRAADF